MVTEPVYDVDILEAIGEEAAFMQLAEEAAELSQAAAKMARYLHGTNPTEMTEQQIRQNIIEEYSDVMLVARMLVVPYSDKVMDAKLVRWKQRIEAQRSRIG